MAIRRSAEYSLRSALDYDQRRLRFDEGSDWDRGWTGFSSLGGYGEMGSTLGDEEIQHNWILDGRRSESQRGSRLSATVTSPTYIRPQVTANANQRDSPISHSYHHQQQSFSTSSRRLPSPEAFHSLSNTRSTLWWGDLEPWMDEEYAKQVCALMGWDNNGLGASSPDGSGGGGVTVQIPRPPPDASGAQANNPGYCFLTFPNSQQAATVLARLNSSTDKMPTMPNSTRPFNLTWASTPVPTSVATPPPSVATHQPINHSSNNSAKPAGPAKEHSIFVGDLAPEASNSDLLAVFRNPILGLRSDRAPKCVRPFYSCKSAKIMLDPVTGVSKGYGFVRFTDQAEQQRALMEMHGLYCLSRPMRVSPATAKYKPASPPMPPAIATSNSSYMSSLPSLTLGSPPSVSSSESQMTFNQTFDTTAPSTGSKSVSQILMNGNHVDKSNDNTSTSSDRKSDAPFLPTTQGPPPSLVTDDAAGWNSPANAQARAILASLTGPNGEQLSSADPYNTTVFVGGLSPLISEDTLRTFFAPFGDIHYVKVPVGKHCGFVQFVRKADAQRAIDRMQGFPIGGSRIRLSWGRSQYKAAQAVVQQAQQQILQQQPTPLSQVPEPVNQGTMVTAQLTPDQALQLLQQCGLNGMLSTAQNGASGEVGNLKLTNQAADSQASSNHTGPQSEQGKSRTSSNEYAPYRNGINRTPPPEPYERSAFSPFEHEHRHSMSEGAKQYPSASHFVPPTFNRTPGFAPSPSLPANLKIIPQEHEQAQGSIALPSQLSSSGSQNHYSPRETPYGAHYYDGASYRAPSYNAQVSDMLRRDSQPIPRSSSNLSASRRSEHDLRSPSPGSFLSAASSATGLADGSDLTGALKSLNLDDRKAASEGHDLGA